MIRDFLGQHIPNGGLVGMQILTQNVWAGAQESAFPQILAATAAAGVFPSSMLMVKLGLKAHRIFYVVYLFQCVDSHESSSPSGA